MVCSGGAPKAALALACAPCLTVCGRRSGAPGGEGHAGGEVEWCSYGCLGSAVVPLNIRASDSFNKPYFRVSANHPDELRMKDLFLL